MDLVIKPFYTGETGATSSNSVVYSATAQPVTIINKLRGFFKIIVSKSLTFQDIVVDSIDSSFSCMLYFSAFNFNLIKMIHGIKFGKIPV
jgi:hypothetical protein